MTPKRRSFLKYLARFQMGFHDFRMPPLAASVVMGFSLAQSVAAYININAPGSGIAVFQKFFALTNFILFFDYTYQHDPLALTLSIQLFYLCGFLAFLGSILAIKHPRGIQSRFAAENFLPGNGFTQLFGTLFIPCLLQPLVGLTVAQFSCSGLTAESGAFPVTRTIEAICNTRHTTLLFLSKLIGAVNLAGSLIFVVTLTLFIIPRNEVPENSIFSQSRVSDFLLAFKKFVNGLLFLNRLYPIAILRFIFVAVLLAAHGIQLGLLLTRASYTCVQSIRMRLLCLEVGTCILVYQLVYTLVTAASHSAQMLSSIHNAAFFVALASLGVHVINRALILRAAAFLRTKRLTSNDLASVNLLYLFSRESTSPTQGGDTGCRELSSQLFDHFIRCADSQCVCYLLKRGEEIWDSRTQTLFSMASGATTDDLIRMVSSSVFVRAWIHHRLSRRLLEPDCPASVKFFYLQFIIFEERNYSLASLLFHQIAERQTNILDRFDTYQLSRVFRSDFIRRVEHRGKSQKYFNVEKFVRTTAQMGKLEESLVDLIAHLLRFYGHLVHDNHEYRYRLRLLGDLLDTIARKFKSLRKVFDGPLPTHQSRLLALLFYQSLCLNLARETELITSITRTAQDMFNKIK